MIDESTRIETSSPTTDGEISHLQCISDPEKVVKPQMNAQMYQQIAQFTLLGTHSH